MLMRVLRHKQVYLGSYRTFLFDQYSIHMLGHIANFTSLVTWLAMLVWTRMFYNAPVYPFNRDLVPERTFWLFIECVHHAAMCASAAAQRSPVVPVSQLAPCPQVRRRVRRCRAAGVGRHPRVCQVPGSGIL